jgi:hypothetical protein
LTLFRFRDDGFARSSDAGIDDNQEDGVFRVVRSHAKDEARGFFDRKGSYLVRDVR